MYKFIQGRSLLRLASQGLLAASAEGRLVIGNLGSYCLSPPAIQKTTAKLKAFNISAEVPLQTMKSAGK